jgi:hypothetical protein
MSPVRPWAPSSQRLPACGVEHAGAAGRLDETARRLDHPELAVARRLAAEGHDVVTVAERGRRGPVPDLVVCGQPVEIKSLLTTAEIKSLLTTAERGDGRRASGATIHNRLVSAVEQAGVVVISTEGSGCRPADAAAGLRSFAATRETGKVTAVRIVGDGFDLGWLAPAGREAAAGERRAGRMPPAPASTAPSRRPVHQVERGAGLA